MKCINNYIYITFDENNRFRKILPGGIEIIIPKVWDFIDEYGQKNGQREENHNQLETNPQIGFCLVGNEKFSISPGDKIYLHFLAYNNRQLVKIDGERGYMIDGNDVFFVINEDATFTMVNNIHLGQQVFDEAPRTESGIYTSPYAELKAECKVKLTHVPDGSPFNIGDEIITIDGAQYPLEYQGVQYIKLLESEIVGCVNLEEV